MEATLVERASTHTSGLRTKVAKRVHVHVHVLGH